MCTFWYCSGLTVVFLLTNAKPFHSWDLLSKAEEERKSPKNLYCGKYLYLDENVGLPNDTSLGRLALELAAVPLFEPGCAGSGAGDSEGSFAASRRFRFGLIQISTFVV